MFGGVLLSPKTVIYLYIPDASGLSGESPVRVDGIDVGRVSSVELSGSKDPNRAVRVTLQFYRDRLRGVPSDSVAQIRDVYKRQPAYRPAAIAIEEEDGFERHGGAAVLLGPGAAGVGGMEQSAVESAGPRLVADGVDGEKVFLGAAGARLPGFGAVFGSQQCAGVADG